MWGKGQGGAELRGGEADACPESNQGARAFIDGGRGLQAETAQSS